MDSLLRRGIGLFNSGRFFEAHEVLEEIWRAAPEGERKFWQGLIQVAVAFHHHSVGNRIGAGSLLRRGVQNLQGYPNHFCGIRLDRLRTSLVDWAEAISEKETGLLPPKIQRLDSSGL